MYRLIFLFMTFMFLAKGWSASHHPEAFLKTIKGSKTEGAQIVQHYCGMCHAEKPLIPLGAPPAGDAAAWRPRIKQGMNVLFRHTDEGLNAMPARGGCFECTDQQLMLAILALLPPKKDNK
jgi:cytochrome c5